MPFISLTLTLLPGTFAVCRLETGAFIPAWATQGSFFSVTRTADEISLVVSQEHVPDDVLCERDWKALKVEGPLDFAFTGILVSVCAPLATAGVSAFALSTYDTDYVLVKAEQWELALGVLRQHHTVSTEPEELRDEPTTELCIRNAVGTDCGLLAGGKGGQHHPRFWHNGNR